MFCPTLLLFSAVIQMLISGSQSFRGPIAGMGGPSAPQGKEWDTLAGDRFIYYEEKLDWESAQARCKNDGFDLLVPTDAVEVAKYINTKYDDIDGPWVGGRGDGSEVKYVSGAVVGRDAQWYKPAWATRNQQYDDVSTGRCMLLTTWGNIAQTKALNMESCSNTRRFLCGYA